MIIWLFMARHWTGISMETLYRPAVRTLLNLQSNERLSRMILWCTTWCFYWIIPAAPPHSPVPM
jgi:hypothetical protein